MADSMADERKNSMARMVKKKPSAPPQDAPVMDGTLTCPECGCKIHPVDDDEEEEVEET